MSKSLKRIIKGAIILSLVFMIGSIFAPKASAATKAWSKNASGQFVNDKGQVIKGATMKGIDVSKWNGTIDWKKVSKTDVDFAIIRCGFGDNYASQDDKTWEKNVQGCIKYNIPFSTYIYSYAKNTTQAKSEADHALRLLNGRDVWFPVYYDMEEGSQAKLGKTKVGNIANTFLNAINAQGYKSGIYANLNWWLNYIPLSISNNLAVSKWVAQWDSNPEYKGTYDMWQCTSNGSVNGISGRVDINFWFGKYNPSLYKRSAVTAKPPVSRPAQVKIKSTKVKRRTITIKWKKAKGAVGYKVRYSTKKSMSKYKTKFVKSKSVKLKKLKARKRYYIKVRAYNYNNKGARQYAVKWSKRVSKKTKRW